MSRVPPLQLDELDSGQQAIYRAISGQRGGIVDGPFRVWLRAKPELASRMNDVSDTLRMSGKLDKRLFEIAILCVARFWNSDYQWSAHGPLAIQLGLKPEVVEAIGASRRPETAKGDELLVYDITMALLAERAIPQPLYDRMLVLVGFEQLVELITTIGQYSMAATVLNGFAIEPLSGGPRLS